MKLVGVWRIARQPECLLVCQALRRIQGNGLRNYPGRREREPHVKRKREKENRDTALHQYH